MPDIQYVFIHPYARTSFLHQSGLDTLGEEPNNAELNANEAGRGGRTGPSTVVYLFEFDDSDEALLELEDRRKEKLPCRHGDRERFDVPRRTSSRHSSPTASAATSASVRAPPRGEAKTFWSGRPFLHTMCAEVCAKRGDLAWEWREGDLDVQNACGKYVSM